MNTFLAELGDIATAPFRKNVDMEERVLSALLLAVAIILLFILVSGLTDWIGWTDMWSSSDDSCTPIFAGKTTVIVCD